ncbi:MAG: Flp pilus assembly protein CpaB [Syntrophorhabdales bacterium]|jgi:pilus assembly protein CpaB
MGRNKALAILGIGVLIALIASLFTYGWLQKKGRVQAETLETMSVVVASSDLPWGTMLTADMVKLTPFLKQSLPEGYFSDTAKVTNPSRTLVQPVKANEPIFESRLAPTGSQGGGVAAVITPKKRAMAVKVDKVVGVSGFIHPGNRVDVLVTLAQVGKVATPITKTVLENVLVLATGADVEKSGNREKPSQVDVITLEVSPEDGEKLALAASEGKLQLALRNSADTGDVVTKGTTFPVLIGSYSLPGQVSQDEQHAKPKKQVAKKQIAQPAPLPPRPMVSVELVKGGTISSVNFNKGE